MLTPLLHALRRLRRSPGHTLLGALILALSLGLATALVAVVRATLLDPLPYRQPDRLVGLWETNRTRGYNHNIVSPANFLDWRDRSHSFSDLALYTWSGTVLTGEGEPERLSGRAVTPNLLGLLGVEPVLGRGFTAADADSGAVPTMILSWDLWQRRFGGRADVINRLVQTESGRAQIVGVMPRNFLRLGSEEYWEPFRLSEGMRIRRGRYTMALGRLAPGITLSQAQQELDGIGRALEPEHPEFNAGWGIRAIPLREDVVGAVERPLTYLLVAVVLVLLIAASNLGNLLLVMADARRRDFAVERAMGASRARVIGGWVLESVLVALLGAGAGALLAIWAIDLAPRLGSSIPRIGAAHFDGALLAGMLLTAVALGAFLGLTSVLGMLRGDPATGLKTGGRVAGGVLTGRLRAVLVSGQVALTLVLLYGAGLLFRSFDRLAAVAPGFEARGVLTAEVTLPDNRYPGDQAKLLFFDQLRERLRRDPSVTAVGAVNFLPFTGYGAGTGFRPTDRPAPAAGEAPIAGIRIIDEDYFRAMRIRLTAGRQFAPSDRADAPPVVIVSAQLARNEWPNESPIGKRVLVEYGKPEQELEVIGVVGDVLHDQLDGSPRPTIYYPVRQLVSGNLTLVLRTDADPALLAPLLNRAVRELDPLLPIESLQPLESRLADSLAGRRASLLLLGGFAALAMLLAAVGLYGVLAQIVRLRTREIGIRLALGSTPAGEQGSVLRGALRMVLAGAAAGALGATAASVALRSFLFAVPPADPVTIGLVLLGLLLVATAASLFPARRAAQVDPAITLRSE
jgi:putative ABC transport system permease protein